MLVGATNLVPAPAFLLNLERLTHVPLRSAAITDNTVTPKPHFKGTVNYTCVRTIAMPRPIPLVETRASPPVDQVHEVHCLPF